MKRVRVFTTQPGSCAVACQRWQASRAGPAWSPREPAGRTRSSRASADQRPEAAGALTLSGQSPRHRGSRACPCTPTRSSDASTRPPNRPCRSPRPLRARSSSGPPLGRPRPASVRSRHRSMKCSWAADRSFKTDARHLAMNAAGVKVGFSGCCGPIARTWFKLPSTAGHLQTNQRLSRMASCPYPCGPVPPPFGVPDPSSIWEMRQR